MYAESDSDNEDKELVKSWVQNDIYEYLKRVIGDEKLTSIVEKYIYPLIDSNFEECDYTDDDYSVDDTHSVYEPDSECYNTKDDDFIWWCENKKMEINEFLIEYIGNDLTPIVRKYVNIQRYIKT